MAFTKRTITDRSLQYPSRYTLYDATTAEVLGTFDLIQETGTVLSAGTKVDKDLLQRYEDNLDLLNITIGTVQPVSGWWLEETATNKVKIHPPGSSSILHPETDSNIVLYSGSVPGVNNIKAAVDKMVETKTATITTTWSGASPPYTQVIAVAGMTANDRPLISPVYDGALATALAQKEAWNMVSKITTQTGSMMVVCFEEKPTVAIPVQIKGV